MLYMLKIFKCELKEKKFMVLKEVDEKKKPTISKVENFLKCLTTSYNYHHQQIAHLRFGYYKCLYRLEHCMLSIPVLMIIVTKEHDIQQGQRKLNFIILDQINF